MKLLKPLCPVQCNSLSIYTNNKDFLYGAISCSTSLTIHALKHSVILTKPTHTHTCTHTLADVRSYASLMINKPHTNLHSRGQSSSIIIPYFHYFILLHPPPPNHHKKSEHIPVEPSGWQTVQSSHTGWRTGSKWQVKSKCLKKISKDQIPGAAHHSTQHTHKQQHFKQT